MHCCLACSTRGTYVIGDVLHSTLFHHVWASHTRVASANALLLSKPNISDISWHEQLQLLHLMGLVLQRFIYHHIIQPYGVCAKLFRLPVEMSYLSLSTWHLQFHRLQLIARLPRLPEPTMEPIPTRTFLSCSCSCRTNARCWSVCVSVLAASINNAQQKKIAHE